MPQRKIFVSLEPAFLGKNQRFVELTRQNPPLLPFKAAEPDDQPFSWFFSTWVYLFCGQDHVFEGTLRISAARPKTQKSMQFL